VDPKSLAVLLNVSQGQMARAQNDLNAARHPYVLVSRYNLETWQREMRDAETYLRDWFRENKETK
jgi:hypothetical protein